MIPPQVRGDHGLAGAHPREGAGHRAPARRPAGQHTVPEVDS